MTVVIGVGETIRRLGNLQEQSIGLVHKGVARGVLGGASIVRGKASGRPGPRAPTGDFRRSIVGDTQVSGKTVLGQIGTNKPQGRRLEYGFVGADVLGRVYNQPPYPYLGPAVPEVERMLINEVAKAIGDL